MYYDDVTYTETAQRYKNGANWFYWIAGLSIVTSLISFGGGGWRFLLGLGITQIIDGFGDALATEVGGGAKAVALVLDLIVTGVFVVFGWLANKRQLWAYIIGMVAFGLDGLLSLLFQDWIGLLAHGFVLYCLFRGFQAGRELQTMEQSMAEQPQVAI